MRVAEVLRRNAAALRQCLNPDARVAEVLRR
jgi:hypothetical protein